MVDVLRQELGRNGERMSLGDIALSGKGAGPGLVVDKLPAVMQDDRIAKVGALAEEVRVTFIIGRNDIGILEKLLSAGCSEDPPKELSLPPKSERSSPTTWLDSLT